MIPLKNLSKKDKLAIAEFIYSQQQQILIKSDAESVVEVFKSHSVQDADKVEIEEYAILSLIRKNIEQIDIRHIMLDYYNGKL